jgi:hypothetical protein
MPDYDPDYDVALEMAQQRLINPRGPFGPSSLHTEPSSRYGQQTQLQVDPLSSSQRQRQQERQSPPPSRQQQQGQLPLPPSPGTAFAASISRRTRHQSQHLVAHLASHDQPSPSYRQPSNPSLSDPHLSVPYPSDPYLSDPHPSGPHQSHPPRPASFTGSTIDTRETAQRLVDDIKESRVLLRLGVNRSALAEKAEVIYSTFVSDLMDLCKQRAGGAGSVEELAMHRALATYAHEFFIPGAQVKKARGKMVEVAVETSLRYIPIERAVASSRQQQHQHVQQQVQQQQQQKQSTRDTRETRDSRETKQASATKDIRTTPPLAQQVLPLTASTVNRRAAGTGRQQSQQQSEQQSRQQSQQQAEQQFQKQSLQSQEPVSIRRKRSIK